MTAITDLHEQVNMTTGKLVLLTVLTMGIYPVLWVAKTNDQIKKVSNTEVVSESYPIWMAGCAGWAAVFASAHNNDANMFGLLFNLALAVLYVIWAFKAKAVIENYVVSTFRVDPGLNNAYAIIFNIFYICYCINDLPEAQKKQQLLSGSREEKTTD